MAETPTAAFADAIVVAAGSSARMAGIDKLREPLAGRSVLEWAVGSMAAATSVGRVIVVTAAERVEPLSAESWVRAVGALVVAGGARRQDSVAAGLERATEEIVLVHDAARPFVSPEVVDAVAWVARAEGAALPIVPVVDALKRLDDGAARTVDADGLYRAQTPQGARRTLLIEAFRAAARSGASYRDEAAMLEATGIRVSTVAGDPASRKITEPADLDLARALAAQRTAPTRYATATDTHPFGPGDGLALGGVIVEGAPRLFGHSDGDVVLHAIADALLGAASKPDLGRAFPASDPATREIASSELLRSVVVLLAADGWRAATVDVSILGARPRLGARRLDEMRTTVAALLDLPPAQVSVKASTGNLSGPEGAGSVISATALVGIARA